jgi:hypothetical protein
MKTCAFAACFLLIAGCAYGGDLSATSSTVNIDGTWGGQSDGVMGGPPMTFIFNFKVDGDTLTGTVNGGPGQFIPLEEGKIKGKKISFTVNAGSGKMKMTVKYKGKIKGDKIKLSYTTKMPGMRRAGGFAETGFDMGGRGNFGDSMGSFGIGGFGMGGFGMDGDLDLERVK